MESLENHLLNLWYIIANTAAILILLLTWKLPRVGRLLFFVVFAWACWMNWTYAIHYPDNYLEYADLTPVPFYKHFILGWFSKHILLMVGAIATCQGMIAISMLLRGWLYKTGSVGGIVFLLAIVPLGVGSGFPCPLFLAFAMYLLSKDKPDYLWHKFNENYIKKHYGIG